VKRKVKGTIASVAAVAAAVILLLVIPLARDPELNRLASTWIVVGLFTAAVLGTAGMTIRELLKPKKEEIHEQTEE
jgi:hypothetical protein